MYTNEVQINDHDCMHVTACFGVFKPCILIYYCELACSSGYIRIEYGKALETETGKLNYPQGLPFSRSAWKKKKKKPFFFISSVLFPNNNYNKTSYLKQKKNVENLWKACETIVKYFKSRVEVRALNGVRLRPTGPDLKFSRRNCIHDYTVLKRRGRKPFFRCVKNKFRYISHA